MSTMATFRMRARTLLLAGFAAAALVALPGGHEAHAQTRIKALVNQTPITTTEISERQAFVKITQRKNVSAKEALETLIDEQLIQQEAKRRGLTISDGDVDERFNAIAGNMKLSSAQLGQALSQAGASSRTFKENIRTQLIQRKLIPALIKAKSGVSEKDIAAQMMERKQSGQAQSFRYVLQQIVFVVPQGSSQAYTAQRRNQAEAFRKQVSSCDQAVASARQIRDVAAKPRVIRMSAQLPGNLRDEMAKLSPGKTMPVTPGSSGLEFVVVCEKKDAPDDTALRQEIQNELAGEQSKGESEKFVSDLRRKALIQYR
ncbi:SurA N-terminal domain-containing protein [Terrihabitans sp. B22-R8]|uniref:SurA N-terminal domain-containing protein n=1 Tax=Terrihabitans sp. B22-R8 TaxID=3425128 RepID=UPI00403D5071